jgi:hypothetical protein
MGLTSRNGASLAYDETTVELIGGQCFGVLDEFREMVTANVSFELMESSLATMKTVLDGSTAVSGGTLAHTVRGAVTRHFFELLGPGPDGASRRLWGTATLHRTGDTAINKQGYQVTPCEARFMIDAATNLLFTIVDTAASTTAPTVASFQEVTSAGSESTITDPDTDFGTTSSVQATFSKAIAPSELDGRHFSLIDITGGNPVAFTVAYGETTSVSDMTKIKVTPAAALTGSANAYKLAIKAGVEALDGALLAAGTHIDFSTPS